MSRILIVEDFPNTLDQIEKTVSEEFLDIEIDGVETAEKAIENITRAEMEGKPYSIALLDLLVPETEGVMPEILNLGVYEAFRQASPRGDIVYVTAYAEEPPVKAHMETVYNKIGEPRPALIKKSEDASWVDELLKTLHPMVDRLRRERIEARFSALFASQGPGTSAPGGSKLRTKLGNREMGHELSAFKLDAETHWNILSEHLRQKIEVFFQKYETSEGGVKLVFAPKRLRGDD